MLDCGSRRNQRRGEDTNRHEKVVDIGVYSIKRNKKRRKRAFCRTTVQELSVAKSRKDTLYRTDWIPKLSKEKKEKKGRNQENLGVMGDSVVNLVNTECSSDSTRQGERYRTPVHQPGRDNPSGILTTFIHIAPVWPLGGTPTGTISSSM